MNNHLGRLSEFREILKDYHIVSDNPVLHSTQLVLMLGPSAVGRDTIIRELEKTGEFRHLVSNTTRKSRINNGVTEQNGVEYWFKSEDEMLDDLRHQRMLEAEIIHEQHVSGISLAELERIARQNKIAITNVELNIKNIMDAKPDAIPIMVLPPSFEEGLRRLSGRGDLAKEEVMRRLKTAIRIYEAGLSWDMFDFVINDEVQHSAQEVIRIVHGQKDEKIQKTAKTLLHDLFVSTKSWISKNN